MKYVVVLHGDSPIGRMYLTGNNDGRIKSGIPDKPHVALDCSEIDLQGSEFIFVKRVSGDGDQMIHIPGGAVVAIYVYRADEQKPAIGFMP